MGPKKARIDSDDEDGGGGMSDDEVSVKASKAKAKAAPAAKTTKAAATKNVQVLDSDDDDDVVAAPAPAPAPKSAPAKARDDEDAAGNSGEEDNEEDDDDDGDAGADDDDDDDDDDNDDDDDDDNAKSKKRKAPPAKGKAAAPSKAASKPAATKKGASDGDNKENENNNARKAAPLMMASTAAVDFTSDGVDITRGPDISTESAAKALILKYFKQQNRPYSALQVHDNLHKRIQKPTVERVLNTLSESTTPGQRLICKEYGKAKIYFPDQHDCVPLSESELRALEAEIETLSSKVQARNEAERALKARLTALAAEPTDNELDSVLATVEKRVGEKRDALQIMKRIGPCDPKQFDKAIKEHNQARTAWKDRRANCMEVVEMIAEGTGKKVKQITADMDIETDEATGAVLPPLIPERKAAGKK